MNKQNEFDQVQLVHQANEERARVLARIGSRVLHAPGRIIAGGIEDFRRYRRPVA